jgi:hypothetical protein
LKLIRKKSEKCISGIATFSRHSLSTQPKSREEKRAWLYNNQLKNSVLKHAVECTNLKLAPTGSHINKQVQIVLVA